MEAVGLLDRAGRRRSQATLSGFHRAACRATKVSAIRRTRHPWRKSSP
jgi:hypothetical protein